MSQDFDVFNGDPNLRHQLNTVKQTFAAELANLLDSLEQVPYRLGDALREEAQALERRLDPRHWLHTTAFRWIFAGTILAMMIRRQLLRETQQQPEMLRHSTNSREALAATVLRTVTSMALNLALESALRHNRRSRSPLPNLDRS